MDLYTAIGGAILWDMVIKPVLMFVVSQVFGLKYRLESKVNRMKHEMKNGKSS